MVHTYPFGNDWIALDVDTGSVHLLDKAAHRVVELWKAHTPEEIVTILMREMDAQDARDAVADITALVEEGVLFTDLPVAPEDIKPPEGMIKALCLHIAHDCDLRCRYCFASTGTFHGSRVMMSAEVGKRALDFLIANSGSRRNLEVDFFGGEPLMNLDAVKEIVEYGRTLECEHGKELHFTLTTNATALSDDAIEFINAEMDNCVLSLDGRREVHDYMRPAADGKGSFDAALANSLRLVKARGDKSYYVRGTFTSRNLDFANDVVSLADAGFTQLSVEPVVLPESSPYALHPEHLPQILAEYDRLLNVYLRRRKDRRWFSFFHFVVDLEGGPCLRKRLTGCGAGYEYLAITPEGELYPCHQFVGREGFRLGSLDEGLVNQPLRERFAGNHALEKPACRDCWAKYHCGGGCAANAQAFGGDIGIPYEMECAMERKRLECAIAVHVAEALEIDLNDVDGTKETEGIA